MESAYIGVATQVVVKTAVGTVQVFAQNIGSGGRLAPGSPVTLTWSPDTTFVVASDEQTEEQTEEQTDEEGGTRMNPRMTRDQLIRRGAAGATLLSLPGLLAACGGGDGGGGGDSNGELAKAS